MTNFIQHRKFGRYKPMYRSAFAHPRKKGFTLVELLVVVVIAGILMSMVLVALRGAQEDADRAKTRATIRKIDVIIQDRYESYRYATLDFILHTGTMGDAAAGNSPLTVLPANTLPSTKYNGFTINGSFGPPLATNSEGVLQARTRLALTRDKIRLEMPDCFGDMNIYNGSYPLGPYLSEVDINTGYLYAGNVVYARLRHQPLNEQIRQTILSRATDTEYRSLNFNAELLFLIVESSYVAGSYGIESFSNSEMGDTDNDGLREFLDSWGRPIQWVRWPSGFAEDYELSQQFSLRTTGSTTFVNRYDPDPLLTATAEASGIFVNRDDFDLSFSDIGYAIYSNNNSTASLPGGPLRPLIVSGGSDGQTALRFHFTGPNAAGFVPSTFSVARTFYPPAYNWPDPYFPRTAISGSAAANIDDPVRNVPLNRSLGGVLNYYVDYVDDPDDSITPTPFSPVLGFYSNGKYRFDKESIFEGDAPAVNKALLELTSDNVTNFDETGGAL